MLPFATQIIENLANHLLQYDPDTKAKLTTLDGKTIAFHITDWNVVFYVVVDQQQLQCYSGKPNHPDAEISGKLTELFKLARQKKGFIEIKGDVELGLEIRQILSKIDIDWEELLAQWTGDIAAHHVVKKFKQIKKLGNAVKETFSETLRDYLLHEARCLPTRQEVQAFCEEVNTLRYDVDRLEARLRKLR